MRKIWTIILILLPSIGLLLSSCTPLSPTLEEIADESQEGTLRPYPTETPTATPFPTGYHSPTPSPTITPTATPVYYEVQLGDDMYSIAYRYNISPQAIMTANPTVNPNAMTVGTELLIPITPMPQATATATGELSPTATPLFANLQEPDCYLDALGGLWCFVLVENDQIGALENVSGVITLTEGDEIRQETAILPLNLLPAGKSLPLIAYFQPQVSSEFTVSAQVDFLLPVMPDDQRYLTTEIKNLKLTLQKDDRAADVTGEIHLPEGERGAEYVWVNATAFDEDGNVLGVRRWDRTDPVPAGEILNFNLTVYSMGGAIERVDLVVEVRAEITLEE